MVQMAWDRGPIPIMERARDDRNWFKAIVFSAIQLKRYGYLAIKEYFEHLKVNAEVVDKLLKRIHLIQIAEYLLAIGKINSEEFETIKQINEERNSFMHRRDTKRFQRGKDADRKYKPLVNKAIRILEEKLNDMREQEYEYIVRLHISK